MLKKAFIKSLIILIPTYIVAYLTEMMVYTIPMLAASSIFATSMFSKDKDELRVDEDGDSADSDDSDDCRKKNDVASFNRVVKATYEQGY